MKFSKFTKIMIAGFVWVIGAIAVTFAEGFVADVPDQEFTVKAPHAKGAVRLCPRRQNCVA